MTTANVSASDNSIPNNNGRTEVSSVNKNAYVKTLKDGIRVYKSDMNSNLTYDEKVELFKKRISTVVEESYQTDIPPKNAAHKGVKYWYKYSLNIIFDGKPITIVFNVRDKGKSQFVYLIEVRFNEKNKTNNWDTFEENPKLALTSSSYDNSIPNNNGRIDTENAQNGKQNGKATQ